MSAFLVLAAALLSRILPIVLHSQSWNFTALGGGLLFFGSRMGGADGKATGKQIALKLAAALALLMATDYYLTVYGYGLAWHTSAYLVTWVWYAAICLIGMGLLQRPGVLRCAAATLASATSFFLLSNGAVWAGGAMYPHTLAGLGTALAMGLPFYRNDLVSTGLTLGVLFGLPALARKIAQAMEAAHGDRMA
ncbi:MAG TPA: DUF6580 family putative transport protein [Acidobacteriaceae bacterium]